MTADLQPVRRRYNTSIRRLVLELAETPGEWHEVGRYPADRRKSAWSRGSQTTARYPQLEYAVQREGDEFVLYFRANESTVNTDHTDEEQQP